MVAQKNKSKTANLGRIICIQST